MPNTTIAPALTRTPIPLPSRTPAPTMAANHASPHTTSTTNSAGMATTSTAPPSTPTQADAPTSTYTSTNTPLPPLIPLLGSPKEGTILDNGRADNLDDIIWDFDWSDYQGATKYHLYVTKTGAAYPVIDSDAITSSSYRYICGSCYIMESVRYDWTWKVRAFVTGQWGEWSEIRTFSAEPVDSDAPIYTPIPPDTPTPTDTPTPQTPVIGQNLIRNESFEEDPRSSETLWFIDQLNTDLFADWSAEQARTGSHALFLSASRSGQQGWPGWFTTSTIPIVDGYTYTFSAWEFTSDGAGAWLEVFLLDANGQFLLGLSTGCLSSPNLNSWQLIGLSFSTNDAPGAIQVRLGLQQCLTFTEGRVTSLFYDDIFFGVPVP